MPLSRPVIEAILARGKLYEVGGCVRDRLLGFPLAEKDYDYLITGIPLDDLVTLLSRFGKVDLVGRSFGVIKFTQHTGGEAATFDIALPRKEFSTGVGHKDFAVSFDPQLPVEEDLKRRDFTINAMARDLARDTLIDPLAGQKDLQSRTIRMVHPKAFAEDPLRMLRGIQFAARFAFTLETETRAALKKNVGLITSVSAERIAEELNKLLLKAQKPSTGFRLMAECGMLPLILPELAEGIGVDQPGGYHAFEVFEHSVRTVDEAAPKLVLRLAALFHDVAKPRTKTVVEGGATFYNHDKLGAETTRTILTRLRYSQEITEEVCILVERHLFPTNVTDKGLRRLVRRVGQNLIFDLLDLRRADVAAQGMGGKTLDVDEFERRIREELAKKPPFGLRDLAVNGEVIMQEFGLAPGPKVGQVLNFLLEKVLDDPEYNVKERLLDQARIFLRKLEMT